MNGHEPGTPVGDLKAAFAADDAAGVQAILQQHPPLKALLGQPIGPFDSPAIVNVRSREMLDVLLEAGADIDDRSRWWAGGFGLLDLAEPELARHAIERGATVNAHAAALQAAHKGPNPVLIRIETKAGHGAGKPTSKQIEEAADKWAFLTATLGIAVKPVGSN